MARTYNEDEVALILASAAERARRSKQSGVTLAELEAAAHEAGLDGPLVRQAAMDIARVDIESREEGLYGASTRLVSRAVIEGRSDIEAIATRLCAEMVDQAGEPGSQSKVGEARVWQTSGFGSVEAGQQARRPSTGAGFHLS
ncbi:MAG: hypothetical protein ACRBN8_24230 [Nannocystales bacterium]